MKIKQRKRTVLSLRGALVGLAPGAQPGFF